ncbi:MspA family porin [Gordonia hirsuta]|nr:MspA family porin [Gordonia hirsuta]
MGAGTADAARLPGGYYAKNVPGGGKVTIRLSDEYVRHTRSVANNHFSRDVWASGKVRISTTAPLKGGTVSAGYLVGCQLDFGATAGVSGGFTDAKKLRFATPELKVPNGPNSEITILPAQNTYINKNSGGSAGIAISPGQAVFQPVIRTKVDGNTVNAFTFTGTKGGVVYSQERFGVSGCAGFAQARALVNVRVATDEFRGNVTMYGKPFSIG